MRRVIAVLAVAGIAALLATNAVQAQQQPDYQPQRGQAGKDVMWLPSPDELVARMLDMANVTPNDTVIDLGSGDGRVVLAAARRGAKAIGIEYDPRLVELSQKLAEKEGLSDRASFIHGDIFQVDYSYATVLTLFLLDELNLQLRPTILGMKPGTRVVSNTFTMGDWEPDNTVAPGGACTTYCKAFFWIVPVKVAGKWQTPQGELMLDQTFQTIKGSLRTANGEMPVSGKLAGNDINFTAGGVSYSGRVDNDAMTLKSDRGELSAMRAGN